MTAAFHFQSRPRNAVLAGLALLLCAACGGSPLPAPATDAAVSGDDLPLNANETDAGATPADVVDAQALEDAATDAVAGIADGPPGDFDLPLDAALPDLALAEVAVADVSPPDAWSYNPPPAEDVWPATCPLPPGLPDAGTSADAGSADAEVTEDAVWISANGCNPACPNAPVPVIEITEGSEVVPQTTLHISAVLSYAVTGCAPDAAKQIVNYAWTVKQPPGSVQTFASNNPAALPVFNPNTAGEYQFCLIVTDSAGVASCAPVCLNVIVVPDIALHIELLWNTPADPDPSDFGPNAGADLDLHVANSLAAGEDFDCDGVPDPWFNNPNDCFWFNSNPAWGSADPAIADDPNLDLDDTDGAGPENFNLDQPEGTALKPAAYPVGVHYWNAHGFGESYATVNLYIFGQLEIHLADVKMRESDMWYVGKVHWPNTLTGATEPPFETCFETGNPCQAAGKMWEPTGCNWCITPCNWSPLVFTSAVQAKPPWCP